MFEQFLLHQGNYRRQEVVACFGNSHPSTHTYTLSQTYTQNEAIHCAQTICYSRLALWYINVNGSSSTNLLPYTLPLVQTLLVSCCFFESSPRSPLDWSWQIGFEERVSGEQVPQAPVLWYMLEIRGFETDIQVTEIGSLGRMKKFNPFGIKLCVGSVITFDLFNVSQNLRLPRWWIFPLHLALLHDLDNLASVEFTATYRAGGEKQQTTSISPAVFTTKRIIAFQFYPPKVSP